MIRKRQRPGRRPVAIVGLALVGLALTGCNSLGIHPGSAVVVGSRTESMRDVDNTASLYCQAYLPTIKQQSQSGIPKSLLRQFVAASITERMIGQELAVKYDVGPASGYAQHQAQVASQFSNLPADQLAAVLRVEGGDPYLQNIQVAVGRQLTGNFGAAAADLKAAQQRGQVATTEWLNQHTAVVDPSLGVVVEQGQVKGVREQTSFPVSALSVAGAQQSGQPPATYTSSLTPSQVCG